MRARAREREVLAQVILEAEKSHDLPSARWRPWNAGVVQRPESWEADDVDYNLLEV